MMKKISILVFFLMITATSIFAQSETVEMADAMRSNGKIYVVIGVITIVFTGIVIYLVSIDRKVSRLEQKYKQQNNH